MKRTDFLNYEGFDTDDIDELATIQEIYSLLVDRKTENIALLDFIIDRCNLQKQRILEKKN